MNAKTDSLSPACLLCESGEAIHYLELPDRFNMGRELYHLYECRRCGIIFTYPQISETEISAHYRAENYDPFMETVEPDGVVQKIYAKVKPWALNYKARMVSKGSPFTGKLLDIGCGTGSFLWVMLAKGFRVQGVEKDFGAAQYGREKLGLDIFIGDLADADFPAGEFQVITMWHSLEHIHRLRENMLAIRKIAAPGAKLFIALPNLTSLDARVYKAYWAPFDVPRHLWHFRPEALARLLSEYGFKLEQTKALPLDPFYNCLLSEGMISGRNRLARIGIRLPLVSGLSFIYGYMNPNRASSTVYCFGKI